MLVHAISCDFEIAGRSTICEFQISLVEFIYIYIYFVYTSKIIFNFRCVYACMCVRACVCVCVCDLKAKLLLSELSFIAQ